EVLLTGTNFPFEIRGVPPGSYDLYPIFVDGPQRFTGADQAANYTGRTPVEIGSEDVTNVTAVIRPGVDLKGQVSIVGLPPKQQMSDPEALMDIQVRVVSIDNLPAQFN